MKYKILFIVFVFASICINNAIGQNAISQLKIMTYNVRYDNSDDGKNAWKERREALVNLIKNYKTDIIGTQEVLKNQLDYIAANLPGFGWTGIGRDDGKQSGEYSAIFFNREKFELIESNTFWCSQTPGKPGLGWDAVCNRIVSWGKFKDKKTEDIFYVFNTHFDHIGVKAREKSAELLINKIKSICGGEPVIITGDFNSMPDDNPYRIITSLHRNKTRYDFYDSKVISLSGHKGPEGTFNGFKPNEPPTGPIDYIFVSGGISVLSHSTIPDMINNNYPSDHFPVLAELILSGK